MSLNTFKGKKEKYLKKYFDYPNQLEEAIKKADLCNFHANPYNLPEFEKIKKYESIDELLKILNKKGFDEHFNFSYLYKEKYKINDWCALRWSDSGLYIHMEHMNIENIKNDSIEVEMTEDAWEVFYQNRKIILSHFLNGALLWHYKEEDFDDFVTDNKLRNRFI